MARSDKACSSPSPNAVVGILSLRPARPYGTSIRSTLHRSRNHMRRGRYCQHGRRDLVTDDRSPDHLQRTNAVDGSAAAMRQAFLSRTLVGPSKLELTGRGDVMASLPVATGDRISEPMIALGGCSTQHRIVVAGSKSIEMMLELQRRGYLRAAATANCGRPTGQYDVALVYWRRRSFNARRRRTG